MNYFSFFFLNQFFFLNRYNDFSKILENESSCTVMATINQRPKTEILKKLKTGKLFKNLGIDQVTKLKIWMSNRCNVTGLIKEKFILQKKSVAH